MKFLKYIFSIILVVSFLSCQDYLDVNVNPNGAVTPPLKGLLSNVTYNSALNTATVGGTTSFYTQYFASPNQASPTDVYDRVSTSGTWGALYGIMGDIYDLDKFATENGSWHIKGVGKVLMALNLGMAIDVYGDVPYSEALSFETIIPKYDNQEELYTKVISLLDEGIVELNKTNEGESLYANADFIHGGNKDAWIKTAYALKARYLNHLSGTTNYNTTAVLEAISKSYTSNNDDAQVTQFQVRNPWNQTAVNNANLVLGGWLSEQFVDALNGVTFGVIDPRLEKITSPLPNGQYVGTANGVGRTGDGAGEQTVVYLTTNGFYSSTNSPIIVISYSETQFIKAEASLRAGNKEDAYQAYLEGVKSNLNKVGVSSENSSEFMATDLIAVEADNLSLAHVFNQKYITTFLNPEAWVDARRFKYGYKDFTVPANDALNGQFIRRFDYPDTEYQRNGVNVPSVALTTPIFWDK